MESIMEEKNVLIRFSLHAFYYKNTGNVRLISNHIKYVLLFIITFFYRLTMPFLYLYSTDLTRNNAL